MAQIASFFPEMYIEQKEHQVFTHNKIKTEII